MGKLPVALELADCPVLVVGGGPVAERKVVALLAAGARVTLVSDRATAELTRLAAVGELVWRQRQYQPGDLAAARLAVAATDDLTVNREVAAEAAGAGVFCNAAAPPEAGDCAFLAQVEVPGLTIALGTDGASPYVAAQLRRLVNEAIPPGAGALVELMGEYRETVKSRYATAAERRDCWERIWASGARDRLAAGDAAGARAELERCLTDG